MRYEKGHKEATRRRIVEVAARRFREDGVAATGLAGVMAEAGLTNGAFYSHFGSKEDLVRAALLEGLQERAATLGATAEAGGLAGLLRAYLSPRHRDNAGGGCPAAALLPEIARHPEATRAAFTGKATEFVALLAALLPAGSPDSRRHDAVALYGLMLGTLQLARAVDDKRLSDEILESGLDAALALAGGSDSRV